MRVVPVQTYFKNYTNNRTNERKLPASAADSSVSHSSLCTYTPHFKSCDYIRRELQKLKNVIDDSLVPYADENRERFNQVCKIGYNAQEKVDLINGCEKNLFQKKFSIPEDEVFNECLKKSQTYNNYKNNIERFEYMVKNAEENGFMTPKIKKYIDKNRPKMYKYSDEFEQLKPLNDNFCEVCDEMNKGLSRINSTDNETFYNSVKDLRNKHITAAGLAMLSGIPDIDIVRKKADNFEKDGSGLSYYESEKQLSGLYNETKRLKDSLPEFKKFIPEADMFIDENKDYKTAPPSVQTINEVYNNLYTKADEIKENAVQKILIYDKEHPSKISERTKRKTFKLQTQILMELGTLI